MLSFILKAAAAYVLWRILRRVTSRSILENIPGPPSSSLLTGSFSDLFNLQGWDFHQAIQEKYGGVVKINTLFGGRQLYVFDPKALHHIAVKDQHAYQTTAAFVESNAIMFGMGLLATQGEHHRKQRKLLNPVFSIAHMKAMIPTFYVVGHKLRAAFASRLLDGPKEIDTLLWITRTALELVGQAGLGYSFDPLIKDEVDPYVKITKELSPTLTRLAFGRQYILPWAVKIGSPQFRRFIVDMIPWKALHDVRDSADAMHEMSCHIYNGKKRAFEEGDEAVSAQIGHGKDIMSALMRANMDAAEGEKLSESEITGQMSTLIFAAMDTTSAALAKSLYELARNHDIQEKLRNEVTTARKQAEGDLSYDELVSLPLLDAICRETLRLHPPIPLIGRTVVQDIVLPLSHPITGVDGTEIQEILVPKNTNVIISILGANRNVELWGPDATEWKPERWLAPLPDALIDAHMPGVYSHLMTFMGGSHACIGFKFSQLEMKIVLSLLIENFRFELPEGKEIVWQMSGVIAPVVKDSATGKSEMPLRVSLVDSSAK